MDMQKVTSEYRMTKWMQIIKERQAGSQTIDEFCKERDLSRHSYFYWQRKLRKAACTELARAQEPVNYPPEGWIRLNPQEKEKEVLKVEINGCCINIYENTNPELLKHVCRILRTL